MNKKYFFDWDGSMYAWTLRYITTLPESFKPERREVIGTNNIQE